jgi:teichuronic acid biosynthesis glycosyltransferase TuaC
MRVLAVTNMYPTETHPASGAFVASQVDALRAAGVEVDVLFLDRPALGRQVYRGLAESARRRVEDGSPDLVHAMYGGVLARVVTGAVRDRPVLVSFCGSDLLGGGAAGILGWAAGRYNVLSSRLAASRADGVVVKSRNLYEALPRRVDRSRVWIVPSGIDFGRFQPLDRAEACGRLGWDPARPHVLFPAPPARPEKRFPLARAAVSLLDGRVEGPVDLHVLENIPPDDVPTWVNAADAVLMTSAHEGSPNAVKEALACNVAVVSVDVGDVRERLAGIDGCFVAEATPEAIAEKLALALAGPERIDARERVAHLSLERVTEELRRIYAKLAGKR